MRFFKSRLSRIISKPSMGRFLELFSISRRRTSFSIFIRRLVFGLISLIRLFQRIFWLVMEVITISSKLRSFLESLSILFGILESVKTYRNIQNSFSKFKSVHFFERSFRISFIVKLHKCESESKIYQVTLLVFHYDQ